MILDFTVVISWQGGCPYLSHRILLLDAIWAARSLSLLAFIQIVFVAELRSNCWVIGFHTLFVLQDLSKVEPLDILWIINLVLFA